jgi:hypothetical protein
MTASSDVTVQWCIIGPGVTPQRFGCLCESENVTFNHDLWIENQSRNPKAKGKIQYLNNVVYGWGKVGLVGGHSAGDHYLDVAGNYFIKGPESSSSFAGEFAATDKVYLDGNLVDLDADGELKGRAVTGEDLKGATVVVQPWSALPKVETAEEAYRQVVAGAGCSLHRDSVDARLIADATSLGKLGKTVNDPAEMGGFGMIAGGPVAKDSDGDGIPDEWEAAHGMNPNDPADAKTVNADGYTGLEVYLNELAGK